MSEICIRKGDILNIKEQDIVETSKHVINTYEVESIPKHNRFVVCIYLKNDARTGIRKTFDRGNLMIGKDLYYELERLVKKHRRIEWRMVGGNHVEKQYDKFCKKHNGTKHILKDAIRDKEGNYRDSIIYEIVK